MNITLYKLINDYIEQYPNADNPAVYAQNYTDDQLIKILTERQDRQILFYYPPNKTRAEFVYLDTQK